jgi:hypothetical protein
MLSLFVIPHLTMVMKKMRASECKNANISLLVGLAPVLNASASSLYMGSFDFLIALSVTPLILNSKEETSSGVTMIGGKI